MYSYLDPVYCQYDTIIWTHSSSMTRVRGVKVLKISLVSDNSTMNVDFPRPISSEAPIRLTLAWIIGKNSRLYSIMYTKSDRCGWYERPNLSHTYYQCLLSALSSGALATYRRSNAGTFSRHIRSSDDFRFPILSREIDIKRHISLIPKHLDLYHQPRNQRVKRLTIGCRPCLM